MVNLRELSKQEERYVGGNTLCAGCPENIIVRLVLHASKDPVVVTNATGCLEVSSTTFPHTSWRVPWMHNAFENAAATMSGVVEAYNNLRKKGLIKEKINFVTFGGDGGTYDIGLQSLSGALERGHNFLYVVLDNEGYMNTGIQRSSATPKGAWTKTSEVGKIFQGKPEFKKDLTAIAIAHNVPYVAQASPHNIHDLIAKAQKAFSYDGPKLINTLSPCVPGWKYPSNMSLEMAKLAVETCFWPLYEVEQGKWKLNYDPGANKKPVVEFLKHQGRFKHLFKPENEHIIQEIQDHIDKQWSILKKKCEN